MRKKISVLDLAIGMYVDEICGNWIDHPFWKSSFKISSAKQLADLQQSKVSQVWIDLSRGCDVEAKENGETGAGSADEESSGKYASAENRIERVSLDDELIRAEALKSRASQAVILLFDKARMGEALPVGDMALLVDEIYQSVSRNSGALLSLVRLKDKDNYTYLHCVSVCALMIALGSRMGMHGDTLKSLGLAGLLHDIGKASVPLEVLNKPDRLTDEEFDLVKMHALKGWEMLQHAYGADDVALDVCRHHHERTDGTGYPDRVSGDALSVHARMGAICDIYDAVTSDRCYKKAWPPTEALRKMAQWQKGHLDEEIFQYFIKTVGIYPVGTLLKLKSGRLAVVTEQTERSLLEPVVRVFFSTRSNAPVTRELVHIGLSQDAIESVEDPGKWGLDLKKMAGVA
ncbi:MAG TPA: HD-GYP domain-containing protein [Burkholderiales bacterium]|nr:HD-GYP domain-containing protein [Burkholderiales bacterium]